MKKRFLMFLFTIMFLIPTMVFAIERTIDQSWYFWIDESTSTLNIRVKNGVTSGGLSTSRKTASEWASVWQKAYNDPTDIRPMVKHIKFVLNDKNAKFDFNEKTAAYMFNDFINLEDIDFSGVVKDSKVSETIKGMFKGCSKLKEIDLSWMATKEDSLQNMQDLFNGCSSLEKVTLNNPNFISRKSEKNGDGTVTKGGVQTHRMFQNCSKLKEINMSNITLYGRDNSDWIITNAFTTSNLSAIETIRMDNIKLLNARNLDGMFSNLTTLTNFSMKSSTPGDIAPDVETMVGMFQDSFTNPSGTGEVTLDVSGLGKLNNILNMNDFIAGCKGLEVLNIDNLDNSNIGPTNYRHTIKGTNKISQEEARKIGAVEYGREIFGLNAVKGNTALTDYKFPNLKKISAQNANVWMCKNERGLPGSEYWLAANNNDVLYFTNKETTFKPDGKSEVVIDSKRDYVDLIIDRDGNHNHALSPSGSLPDSGTNINIKNGDLNKLGTETFRPGKLAPGVYTIGDNKWDENRIRPAGSYYRISYIGEVDYTIAATGNDEIVIKAVDGVHYINTKNKSKTDWDNGKDANGNYVLDCSGDKAIKITYLKAGQDIEGRLYDIELTINKITFKDIANIPLNPNRGSHDGNRYIDKNLNNAGEITDPDGTYFRTILKASRADGIMFRNYVRVGNPLGYETGSSVENDGEGNYSYRALSGGSGTDIDFSIKFKPATGNTESIKDDKTFVFYVDDLDVPAAQEWEYPVQDDPCYDTLTVDKATYGIGGEAFVLGSGNQLDSVEFAEETGLRLVNENTVVTTGSDPSTSWSEFSVKADPKGSNYTWTSGIPCDTYALRNTIPPKNEIKVIKKWEDRGIDNSPRPDNLDFEIKYTKEGVEKSVTIPSTAVWDKTTKENEWSIILYDDDNRYLPDGGYKATEVAPEKYDVIKGDTPLPLTYNEDTGYFEVTFINKEQTKDIVVTKEWIDTDDQKDKRPSVIVLEIKDSSGAVIDTYELPKDETSYTFTVPKYDKNGDEIDYTVDEKEKNTGDLKFYEKTIAGTKITNTFKVPDEKISINVEKVWKDNDNQKNRRPDKINIQLFGNDTLVDEYELNVTNESSHKFIDLDKYDTNGNEITYTVLEKEASTGDLKYYTKEVGELTGSDEKSVKITNTYNAPLTKVIVKYIDKITSKEIIDTIVIDGSEGDKYNTELKEFENYKFIESTKNESGEMTEEEITVIYYYEKIKYKVETEVVNGEIDPTVEVLSGDTITIKYEPKEGYIIKEVIIDGNSIDITKYPTEYSFEKINKDHKIKVVYEKEEDIPKTLDDIFTYVFMFGGSILFIILIVIVIRKTKKKEIIKNNE